MASPNNPDEGKLPARPVPVVPKPPAAAAAPAVPQPQPQPTAAVAAAPRPPRAGLLGGLLRNTPAWAISMLVHVIVLLAMALIVTETPKPDAPRLITASAPEVEENFEEFEEQMELDQAIVPEQQMTEVVTLPQDTMVRDVEVVTNANDLDAAQVAVDVVDVSAQFGAASDLLATAGAAGGSAAGFGGRTSSVMQSDMVRSAGGDPVLVSRSVEDAITYFRQHQLPDGGWSFDCKNTPGCQGQCDNPKHNTCLKDRVAATALVLWPMLAKGYTHKGVGEFGKHKQSIEQGLAFLGQNVIEGKGKAFHKGGNMYSQALTAVVLSEAYGMTQDSRLQMPAQLAIDYIMEGQDPVGGGWRYTPKQPGDTSAFAWQIVALKSANMSYMRVNPLVIRKAASFLDSVASDDGAAYGYTDASTPSPARNAAGLLCRVFMGWKSDNDALRRGAIKLAKQGPTGDIYHTYYATQVLFHMQKQLPAEWMAWQKAMTDMLVRAQAKEGHQKGSYFKGMDAGHASEAAGRLYVTSMATMTMEVYFKIGVMYSKESADDFVE
jgi:hypothetical protein